MPRALKVDRPKPICVNVPESIVAKVRDQLYSEIENKVPHGALSNLVTEQLREWLKSRGAQKQLRQYPREFREGREDLRLSWLDNPQPELANQMPRRRRVSLVLEVCRAIGFTLVAEAFDNSRAGELAA